MTRRPLRFPLRATFCSARLGALLALLVGLGACSDSTSPEPGLLSLDGPASVVPGHGYRIEANDLQVICELRLVAETRRAAIEWTGLRTRFRDATSGASLGESTLNADQTAALWGGPGMQAGASAAADLVLWAGQLFRATLELHYRAGGRDRVAEHEVACVPVAPGLSGRYILWTIDDVRLPAPGGGWSPITGAFLEFDAARLTFTSRGVVGSSTGDFEIGWPPMGYVVAAKDTFVIPNFLQGDGGRLVRDGTTLRLAQATWGGGAPTIWRFEAEGVIPDLPPLPGLAVRPDTLFFQAVRNGALPAEQSFVVTSTTTAPVTEVTFGTSGFMPQNIPTHMGLSLVSGTYEIWARMVSTDAPVGRYTMEVIVSSPRASNWVRTYIVYDIIEP